MKKRKNRPNILSTGVIATVAAFIVLSGFAGGIVEISRDVGMLRWALDAAVYALANKFVAKLVASLVIGLGAGFVHSMIDYGKSVKSRKHARATNIRFTSDDPPVGRIA